MCCPLLPLINNPECHRHRHNLIGTNRAHQSESDRLLCHPLHHQVPETICCLSSPPTKSFQNGILSSNVGHHGQSGAGLSSVHPFWSSSPSHDGSARPQGVQSPPPCRHTTAPVGDDASYAHLHPQLTDPSPQLQYAIIKHKSKLPQLKLGEQQKGTGPSQTAHERIHGLE